MTAIAERLGTGMEDSYTLKCCGAIFRRRAARELPWLWKVLQEQRAAVLELAEYITPDEQHKVCGLWPPRGCSRGAWRSWLKALEPFDPLPKCDRNCPLPPARGGETEKPCR
jgi:hypothetical protein